MDKTFFITYTHPLRYRGTYVVRAKDGIAASEKCRKYLEDRYGVEKNQNSAIHEVYDNNLIFI